MACRPPARAKRTAIRPAKKPCAKRSDISAGPKTNSSTFPMKRWRIFAKQSTAAQSRRANGTSLVEAYCEEARRVWASNGDETMSGELPEGWEKHLPSFEDAEAMATRVASGKVINALAPHMPMLIGGSADLGVSNNTDIKDGGEFRSRSVRRPHHSLRRARTCDGRNVDRHVVERRPDSLWRHVHDVFRLHAAVDSAGVPFGSPGHLRVHARFGRTGRRWPNTSTRRTPRRVARDSASVCGASGRSCMKCAKPGGWRFFVVMRRRRWR